MGTDLNFTEEQIQVFKIFMPGKVEQTEKVLAENQRFAHYTSAETAVNIIQNQELWLRNATVMNDFSEISYGMDLTRKAFSEGVGENFRNSVTDIFPDAIKKAEALIGQWEFSWLNETYLASISLHDHSEDNNGRLSMWRAYGDVAIVVNNTPLVEVTDTLGVFSTPVRYISSLDFEHSIENTAEEIRKSHDLLHKLGEKAMINNLYHMLSMIAIGSKHPGFAEEKEWRIFHQPHPNTSPLLKKQVVVINGIPQAVWKLPLIHDPANGLTHADLPSLLNRIIIGPTDYPYVSIKAFQHILLEKGVENVEEKVVASDIPLRSHS